MDQQGTSATLNTSLQCSNCGATLHFAPGTNHLQCTYCGTENEITPVGDGRIISFDYQTFLDHRSGDDTHEVRVVSCKNCGASTTLPPEVNSDNCTFCTSPLVLSESSGQQLLKPHYVLPFIIPQGDALSSFRKWLQHLWWAPSDLSEMVTTESKQLRGMYLPHWSYDADTRTHYDGERGDYYYETEYYTETVDGREVRRSRQVRHTDWTYVSGNVVCSFTDLLVSASHSLPQSVASRLEPWHMDALVHYNEQYVSGFRSELYQVDAKQGFEEAKEQMAPIIRDAIHADIGGDEQSIRNMDTRYHNIALKYLILPVWISAYKYNNKLYHFTVNACTGEVVGERPYSAFKIALAVLAGIAVLMMIYFYMQQR